MVSQRTWLLIFFSSWLSPNSISLNQTKFYDFKKNLIEGEFTNWSCTYVVSGSSQLQLISETPPMVQVRLTRSRLISALLFTTCSSWPVISRRWSSSALEKVRPSCLKSCCGAERKSPSDAQLRTDSLLFPDVWWCRSSSSHSAAMRLRYVIPLDIGRTVQRGGNLTAWRWSQLAVNVMFLNLCSLNYLSYSTPSLFLRIQKVVQFRRFFSEVDRVRVARTYTK